MQKKFCPFFAKGSCKFSSNYCKFSHDREATAGGNDRAAPAGAGRGRPPPPSELERWKFLARTQLLSLTEYVEFISASFDGLGGSSVPAADRVLEGLCVRPAGSGGDPAVQPPPSYAVDHVNRVLKELGSVYNRPRELPGGGSNGGGVAAAAAQSAAAAAAERAAQSALRQLTLPCIRLLTHAKIRDNTREHWTNALYARVVTHLDLSALAACLDKLAAGAWPAADFIISTNATASHESAPWQPRSWMELVEPVVLLLQQLLSRFQSQESLEQQQLRPGAERTIAAVSRIIGSHITGHAGFTTTQLRRLLSDVDAVETLLLHGRRFDSILLAENDPEAQQQAQARTSALQAHVRQHVALVRARDVDHAPGSLRPRGPRHSNDVADYRLVSIVPTADELLCAEAPYLPSNAPGSVVHMAGRPVAARLEVNFRLLRHEAVQVRRAVRVTAFVLYYPNLHFPEEEEANCEHQQHNCMAARTGQPAGRHLADARLGSPALSLSFSLGFAIFLTVPLSFYLYPWPVTVPLNLTCRAAPRDGHAAVPGGGRHRKHYDGAAEAA